MIDTDKYEGHSKTIKTGCWKRSDKMGFKSESVFDESGKTIASVKLAGYDTKRVNETYANLLLITDAPKLLAEVKRLTKTLELIAKEMPFDYWLHTLINDVIGYEKWQAKEMVE